MFETVAPSTASRRNRGVLYEALSFSIFVHGLAGIIAAASVLWQVTFPSASPVLKVQFFLSEPAPPPPPPPAAKAQPIEQKNISRAAEAFVAPAVIPDTIPVLKPEPFRPVDLVSLASVAGEAAGVPGGTIGGERDGKIGGTAGGIIMPETPPDGRIHIARDNKLPLIATSQDFPGYPEDARRKGWEDELVVRYVIGKDGRVKEVSVVQPPEREIFIEGTLRAIGTWRFRPFVKDGERREVVHELTVYYRLDFRS